MAAMRCISNPEERERYMEEIQQSVQIYDSMFQTGNSVLDTVLTEKSLHCGANGITLHCIADGHLLDFMDPVDLYGILGNALDNAIESVQMLQQSEQRFIDVLLCAERQFLVLRISNPLHGPLHFRDGLPLSTKASDGYHGFGLKSIRHTVEKYGGCVTVSEEHGCFTLRIMIPMGS
jgi:sensor histidine kinase regulating citrate/malate metabolism